MIQQNFFLINLIKLKIFPSICMVQPIKKFFNKLNICRYIYAGYNKKIFLIKTYKVSSICMVQRDSI